MTLVEEPAKTFVEQHQFIFAIVGAVLLMLLGQWISFLVWKKQQWWTLKRSIYIDSVELLVRIQNLTRQIRSSYLVHDEESVQNLDRTREPLFIDVDAMAVKAGFLLPDAKIVEALNDVARAQSEVGRKVIEKLDATDLAKEKYKIVSDGLKEQARIYGDSLEELRKCAVKGLGFGVDFLKTLTERLSKEEEQGIISLELTKYRITENDE